MHTRTVCSYITAYIRINRVLQLKTFTPGCDSRCKARATLSNAAGAGTLTVQSPIVVISAAACAMAALLAAAA